MMRKALCLALALILGGALARPVLAADQPAAAPSVKTEILGQIDDAEKKLVALAEATPAEKYGWRPSDKVRSTGEVLLHIAGHAHEHLGQSIAYARMNGIVPPWSS